MNAATSTYHIGDLCSPQPDDQRFATQAEAEHDAREASYPDRVLGIWRDNDGELVAIAYNGLIYWS